MAKQPDEVRPSNQDDGGPGHTPQDSLPKETPPGGDSAQPHHPAPEPHATGEGAVLTDPVKPEKDDTYSETYHGDDHYHDHDHHDHDHHHDDYHEEHQGSEYGGGTPVPAVATYGGEGGGEPPRDQAESEPTEEEGGPVKSFLDHLEDLRWTLIKCSVAVGVGMLLCLISGNVIMREILLRPLAKAELLSLGDHHFVNLMVGTNVWGRFNVPTNQFDGINLGSNQVTALQVVTVTVGTNQILALAPSTNRIPDVYKPLLGLGPVTGFFIAFQLAIYGGLVLAAPLVIFYLAQFILPALRVKEKKYIVRGFAIGTTLFFAGVFFCYFVLLPVALNASTKYSEWLGLSADQWTAELYLSFVCKFILGMGLGFEMPVVILCLVKIGIVNYQQLAAFRKYMIVINLILGAVLTTPEVLTQVLMAVPLQILYEISVWIAWYWDRRDKKRAARGEVT